MTLSVLPLHSCLLYTFNHYQLSFLSAPLLGTLKYAYEMFMWKEEKTKHNAQFWAVDDPLSFTSLHSCLLIIIGLRMCARMHLSFEL